MPTRNVSDRGTKEHIERSDFETLVRVRFRIPTWRAGETVIVRQFCGHGGTTMLNPGFSVRGNTKVRPYLTLTNSRPLLGERDEEAGLQKWGWAWYIRNFGPETKDVDLEVSFVEADFRKLNGTS